MTSVNNSYSAPPPVQQQAPRPAPQKPAAPPAPKAAPAPTHKVDIKA